MQKNYLLKRKATISYGIVLFTTKKRDDNIEEILYHISQRRDSIAYAEFIKNNLKQEDIPKYIELMSQEERERCLEYYYKKDPQSLWDDLWVNHKTKIYKNDMERCCYSFMENMKKYESLFLQLKDVNNTNPWGFSSKGRRNQHETEKECALREFQEETSISCDCINIIDFYPFRENYIGYDGNHYMTIYYVAYIPYMPDMSNKIMKSSVRKSSFISEEISETKWLNYYSCLDYLDENKREILKEINNMILFKKRKPPKRRFTHN